MNKSYMGSWLLTVAMGCLVTSSLHAAVGIDRTRIIFGGENKSVSLTVNNGDDQKPFLAQGWIEDQQGNKSEPHFVVLPPIQRLEPKSSSQVKVQALPKVNALPQDKESLFYFVMQEIPPKEEGNNMLQIAIQNKIKLIYRPSSLAQSSVEVEKAWASQVSLKKLGKKTQIRNQSPYYLTLLNVEIGAHGKPLNDFPAVMIPPFDSVTVPLDGQYFGSQPVLKYINDHGGIGSIPLLCHGVQCNTKGVAQ